MQVSDHLDREGRDFLHFLEMQMIYSEGQTLTVTEGQLTDPFAIVIRVLENEKKKKKVPI